MAFAVALLLLAGEFLLPRLLPAPAAEPAASLDVRVRAGLDGVRERFLAVERQAVAAAGALAERALRDVPHPTAAREDRDALFHLLEEFDGTAWPSVSGHVIVDDGGTPLAWSGRTFAHRDRSPPGPGASTRVVRTNIYKVIVAEIPLTGPGGETSAAVRTYAPFNASYPLHNRYLQRIDFEREAAEALGLDDVNLFFSAPEGMEGATLPPGTGRAPLDGVDGRRHAVMEVRVRPAGAVHALALAAWSRRLRAAAAVALLLALVLARRLPRRLPAPGDRVVAAGTVLLLRAAWSWLRFPADLGSGALFDPASFSVTWWSGWFATPVEAALTATALILAARALVPAVPEAKGATGGTRAAGAVAGIVAGGALLAFAAMLAEAVAFQSPSELFPPDRVLPPAPAAALLLAVGGSMAGGLGLLLRAAECAAGRRLPPRAVAMRAMVLVSLAAVVASVLVQVENLRALREDALAALERGEPGDEREERASMALLLGEVASPDGAALKMLRGRGPRPDDAAFFLWAGTPDLNARPEGCLLEILDAEGTVRSRFAIDIPPVSWLPEPVVAPGPGEDPAVEVRRGSKGAERRRFLLGAVAVADAEGTVRGSVRVCVPLSGEGGGVAHSVEVRPEILRNYGALFPVAAGRTVHRAVFDGDRLRDTTNPDYPRDLRVPPEVIERVLKGGEPMLWVRETVAGTVYHNAYLPRRLGERIVGFDSVGFPSLTLRPFLLNVARGLFLHLAVLGLAAVLGTGVRRARLGFPRPRISFRARILAGFVLVGGMPVAGLAILERSLATERAEEGILREVRSSLRLVEASLRDAGVLDALTAAASSSVDPGGDAPPPSPLLDDEHVKEIAYRAGVPVSLFLGDTLLASSDRGIFATELFSPRLSGEAYHQVVLLGREAYAAHERFGSFPFLVGYAPVRTEDGTVAGVLSVPLLYRQDQADRDLARTTTVALALYLVVLLGVTGAALLVARRMARPVEALAEGTRRVAGGDLSFRIPQEGPQDELGDLVASFNRMTEGLEAGREAAARAEREAAWREMAKQVAHEIKNPLTPMRLHAQHLERAYRDGAADFPAILEKAVAAILRQTDALRHIATDFSAFARLPRRSPEPLDPAELAREAADLHRGGGGVEVVVEAADGVPAVFADREEMRLVLVNLCGNAVEAMAPRGGGTLTLAVREDRPGPGEAAEGVVVIEVADTGPGIPPDDLPRLFDPNFSTKTGGTGLGLAIVRRAVEDAGGTVAAESTPGAGARFTVRIPGHGEG